MVCLTFHLSFQETRVICILCLNYVCLCVRKRSGTLSPNLLLLLFSPVKCKFKAPAGRKPAVGTVPAQNFDGRGRKCPAVNAIMRFVLFFTIASAFCTFATLVIRAVLLK